MANSSILISLSTIEQLDLLRHRFPEGIIIPQAVWFEVVEKGKGQQGAAEVGNANWISVTEVLDKDFISLLRIQLDQGEAEAIALCREHRADLVLLDEKDARRVAKKLGLDVLGTVGVLVWSRRTGLIRNLREQLDTLQMSGKFRLNRAVYEKALIAAGEFEK